MANRFIITGVGRTGSSYLLSLLSSHPDIKVHFGEVLHPGEDFDRSGQRNLGAFLTDNIFRTGDASAVGAKLLYLGISRFEPGIWHLLRDLDVAVIHIIREDLSETVLSRALAVANDVFTSAEGEYRTHSVSIDPRKFRWEMKWIEVINQHIRRCCEGLQLRYFPVEYGKLAQGRIAHQHICEFLGVPYHELSSDYRKLRIRTVAESIENYDELRDFFANTRWRGMFAGN